MRSIKGLTDEISWLEHPTKHSSYRNTKYVLSLLCWANNWLLFHFDKQCMHKLYFFLIRLVFLTISNTVQKVPFFRAYSWPYFKQDLQEINSAYGGVLNCPFCCETLCVISWHKYYTSFQLLIWGPNLHNKPKQNLTPVFYFSSIYSLILKATVHLLCPPNHC